VGEFRAIVGVNGELQVRSRRGWDMTVLLPELRAIPAEGVFDGELVVFGESGHPCWPLCASAFSDATPRSL
jgi:ATP-dependent DNA ligase